MRATIALVAILLLLLPVAGAGHSPAGRSVADSVEDGAAIMMVVEATGSVLSAAAGERKDRWSLQTWKHESIWTYSWGGTIELRLGGDGTLSGVAELTGGGRGWQKDRGHTVNYDAKGGIASENDLDTDCDLSTDAGGPRGDAQLTARGIIDVDAGMLLVLVRGVSGSYDGDPNCVTTGDHVAPSRYRHAPPPPLSPLVGEGAELLAARREQIGRLDPQLDELQAALGLLFEIPLQPGHATLRGATSGTHPITFDSPVRYVCFTAISRDTTGTCTAAGTLKVRLLVDPCPMLRESRAVHAAAVSALKQPASGSSESQVRAFQVDARQKVAALISDERAIQLMCGGDDSTALESAGRVAQMVVDAWVDVAKTHGLSDDAKRDLLSAQRQSQLLGASDGDAAMNELIGAVLSNPGHGAISVKVHSPVALHAWDDAGRHVGWNATTNASESQIEGANYTGAPGGAQELTLPSGFYKIATIELGAGKYALNTGWNGTGGEGFELLPLSSAQGRTVVANYLLDQHGILIGPTQRVAATSAAFVEPWKPLPPEKAEAPGGAAPTDEESNDGVAPTPGLGVTALLASFAVALLLRRKLW